jgi:hypothetical protein
MLQKRKMVVRQCGRRGTIVLVAGFTEWRAKRALRLAAEEVQGEREIRFDTRPFAPPAVFLRAARFQEHLPSRPPIR